MTNEALETINHELEVRKGSLDLSFCEITDLSSIANMVWLVELKLDYNYIGDRFFSKITKFLNTGKNKNYNILEELPNLALLSLSGNQISEYSFLTKLPKLVSLDLSYNQISDYGFLKNLTNLTSLYLSNNRISNLSFLRNLTNLTTLNLSNNQISNLSFLGNLTNLTTLDLSNNQISNLSFLGNLTSLTTLNLSDNLVSDGRFLEKLPNLTSLNLNYNRISDISPLWPLIEKGLPVSLESSDDKMIAVGGNPIANPPIEIVEQGNTAILEYFRQKEKSGTKLLLEAKLILLGDGRSGKTSLSNRLLGKELPKEEDRTQGVDIVIGQYGFEVAGGEQFKLHIWDFAGQDKYKPLHQLFYTESSLYIMVAASGNNTTDFDDWLQTAALFGEGSPLIILLNEFKDGMGLGTFDQVAWKQRFPELLKEVFCVNLGTRRGFDNLEHNIRLLAQTLPHTRYEYPANWAAIRNELERRRDEQFITLKEYLNICEANNLPEEESALILSSVLHKIGVCLHYQKSELLRQYVILKNEWATEAVYKILEDPIVTEQKKGFFDGEDLKRIWSDKEYRNMRPQLLELMCQFKMAYPLPNGREYVTPPLLPTAPPPEWALSDADDRLEMYVEYEFLPKVLLTQFIVSRHADIDEGRTLVWRNGVVLRWDATTVAEVTKTKSQGKDAFYIRVQGHNRKGLLTAILKTLRDLHGEYKGIKYSEIVPCPCEGCRTGKNKQHYFDFRKLTNWIEKGVRTRECDESLVEIDLVRLLESNFVFERLKVGEPLVMSEKETPKEEKNKVPMAFFSYSKKDIGHLEEFHKHMKLMERNGKIRLWDDRKIRPGEEWDVEIRGALAASDIIFLLLSVDFLNTDYIWKEEMTEAMRRHEAGTAQVIPIKIRDCSWKDTPFSILQALPRKDGIVATAPDRDVIWTQVVKEIEALLP